MTSPNAHNQATESAQRAGGLVTFTRYPEVRVAGRIQTGYRLDCRRTGLAHFLTADEVREVVELAEQILEPAVQEPCFWCRRGMHNSCTSDLTPCRCCASVSREEM